MNKVSVNLTNCFGIDKLEYEFDFSTKNVYSIYAKNGLMKTSFANTFQKIQQGKANEICDRIFEIPGNAIVKIDDKDIEKKDVFVIKSYEAEYESDISSLLIKGELKESLKEVLKSRDKLLKSLEKDSGLKIKRTSQGKTGYELEPTLLKDFSFSEQSILLNLEYLKSEKYEIEFSDIMYSTIFDTSVLKKIKSDEFQNGIDAFIKKVDEIYSSFDFLEKGKLTLPKLKEIRKTIEKDNFFVKGNNLNLNGGIVISDVNTLDSTLFEIETKVKALSELKDIEQLLSDAKGMLLKDVIETHTDIIPYLKISKLDDLRKILWLSYITKNKVFFEELYAKYSKFSNLIDETTIEDTPWKKSLSIFKNRFTVPFDMEVTNLKGAVIGESVPQVEFSFEKNGNIKKIDRTRLDELDTLSQGEKRALYLLNIIFDLEKLKAEDKEVLLIVDDIADSFDYKNKYAIIEYLYELSNMNNIKMIILSHNFDFYRAVSSRLSILRQNRLEVVLINNTINLHEEKYQKQPFEAWKKKLNKENIIALIPFVRNLIEYGVDKKKSGQDDFLFLTYLLHEKTPTDSIKFSDLKLIYKEYLGKDNFEADVNLSDSITGCLYNICDTLTENNNLLEDKILLSMSIRHKAEKIMLREISSSSSIFEWEDGKIKNRGNNTTFLSFVDNSDNQTKNLILGYKQIATEDNAKLMSEVSIMTSENIHLNSFMYEPLLDMDIQELLNLYQRIKTLLGE